MPRHPGRRLGSTLTRDRKSNTRHRKHKVSARGTNREEEPGIRERWDASGTRKEPQREERSTVMLPRRLPVLSALLVLLLAAGRCTAAALLRGSGTRTEGRVDGRGALEEVGRYPRSRTETLTGHGMRGGPERGGRSHHGLEAHSKDPRHKEKFIRHLTGPLYIDPKCRKQFHRLYHNTRDCTVPAFYKRCARLLTQLAKSPRCSDR